MVLAQRSACGRPQLPAKRHPARDSRRRASHVLASASSSTDTNHSRGLADAHPRGRAPGKAASLGRLVPPAAGLLLARALRKNSATRAGFRRGRISAVGRASTRTCLRGVAEAPRIQQSRADAGAGLRIPQFAKRRSDPDAWSWAKASVCLPGDAWNAGWAATSSPPRRVPVTQVVHRHVIRIPERSTETDRLTAFVAGSLRWQSPEAADQATASTANQPPTDGHSDTWFRRVKLSDCSRRGPVSRRVLARSQQGLVLGLASSETGGRSGHVSCGTTGEAVRWQASCRRQRPRPSARVR
jgi:hypothetical protein